MVGKGEMRRGEEAAGDVRTIIFATKATSARPQSEINSSRGLLTLSIIPPAIRDINIGALNRLYFRLAVALALAQLRNHDTPHSISGQTFALQPYD